MPVSKKFYLFLPVGLFVVIYDLWEGRYVHSAFLGLNLLILFHPSGVRDWWAQRRSTGRVVFARNARFWKVVWGIWFALALLIIYSGIVSRS